MVQLGTYQEESQYKIAAPPFLTLWLIIILAVHSLPQ